MSTIAYYVPSLLISSLLASRNCPVLTMEAMNGECQEAIIGAFMHMHPDEIQLTKEQVR